MTKEELESAIEELKEAGNSEEDIACSIYLMFSEGKINLEQFQAILEMLGYELDEDFLNMSEEEQKTFALKSKNDEDIFNEDTIEDAFEFIESLKQEGKSEDEIASFFSIMYEDKKLNFDAFAKIMDYLNMEFEEEFIETLNEIEKEILRKITKDNIKKEIALMKYYEEKIEILRKHNVDKTWIIRPFIMLFLNNHITIKDLYIINNILECYQIIEEIVDEELEIQKNTLRSLGDFKLTLPLKENVIWYKNMSDEEKKEGELDKAVIELYKGYPPYAYNKEKHYWENISFSLNEEDFQ